MIIDTILYLILIYMFTHHMNMCLDFYLFCYYNDVNFVYYLLSLFLWLIINHVLINMYSMSIEFISSYHGILVFFLVRFLQFFSCWLYVCLLLKLLSLWYNYSFVQDFDPLFYNFKWWYNIMDDGFLLPIK